MPVPVGWTRTKRLPIIAGRYEFLSYQAGFHSYLYCEAIAAVVARYADLTYRASVDGMRIKSPRTGKPHHFRTERAAITAAIRNALSED